MNHEEPIEEASPSRPAMFSTAAIALRRRPPARIARMVTMALCIMAAAALAYASLASMDVVVTAQGRIGASGKSKVIQPLEAGVVKAIAVRDGQAVRAGDVLLELDATATQADRDRLQRELQETQADVLRLDALLSGRAWAHDADLPAAMVANQQAVLAHRRSEHNARLAGLDADIARRTADRDAIAAHLAQLRTSLPLVRQKHGMREELASTGFIARTAVIESRLELLNMEKELSVQSNRLSESSASLHAAVQQRQQAQAEFYARTSAERVEAIRKHDAARQELAKATQRRDLQTLRSPIDGVVQQLAVTTVGGVVTPAQPLMSVVPHNAMLEVDAQVLNRDIGHVKVGQRVINKVETFDFTRFGYIEGAVQWVGTDAVNDPKLGPAYPVRIRLNAAETPNTVNGLHGAVMAGMSVTSDIRTGERRLIEYFIAPLLRYQQEALRER
ncbi:MAG: HlyD family type I secretion periplasmic adaptor subunit [Polaromonas sp.]|nr:HlyD family type I secretion periplasmic adaptor subunit [Polaromonas sp.]